VPLDAIIIGTPDSALRVPATEVEA